MTDTTSPTMANVHEMLVVHRPFRREFGLLPDLVRGVAAGDTARAAVIAGHARMILTGLHLHHTGEDDLLWPKLLERCSLDAALVHRMEEQHARVEQAIERLGAALQRWEAEVRPAVTEEVAVELELLRGALLEHLDEEEREILPLVARHVTQEEWNQLGQHGVGQVSLSDMVLMFGAVFEEATSEERAEMLRVVPFPVRILMTTVFARRYRRYITRVRSGR